MMNNKLNIDKLLDAATQGKSKWELDNITYHGRTSNPTVLVAFLNRIKELEYQSNTNSEKSELIHLLELSKDLNEDECLALLSNTDEIAQQTFIENLARTCAIEVLTRDKVSYDSMNLMCKLNPDDFILTCKRTQDIINSVHELVLQGEILSQDVPGA